MTRATIATLVLTLGLGTARGQDPDPVRAQLELARQQAFLQIEQNSIEAHRRQAAGEGALSVAAWQRQANARAQEQVRAEFDRLLNGPVKPMPLSEHRTLLVGCWRGTARKADGTTYRYEATVDGNGLLVNSITGIAPGGAVVTRTTVTSQMSYYQDGVAYLTSLSGFSQQMGKLEWRDRNTFTLTFPGSHVCEFERAR